MGAMLIHFLLQGISQVIKRWRVSLWSQTCLTDAWAIATIIRGKDTVFTKELQPRSHVRMEWGTGGGGEEFCISTDQIAFLFFFYSSSSSPCPHVLVNETLKHHISKSALLNRNVSGGHERLGNTHCSSLPSAALSV